MRNLVDVVETYGFWFCVVGALLWAGSNNERAVTLLAIAVGSSRIRSVIYRAA